MMLDIVALGSLGVSKMIGIGSFIDMFGGTMSVDETM
jgi:hypothetical protein